MSKKGHYILAAIVLMQPWLTHAKCSCVKPCHHSAHYQSETPSMQEPYTPHESQPLPSHGHEVSLPIAPPYTPSISPSYNEQEQEVIDIDQEGASESFSKDDARKMALAVGCTIATIGAFGAIIFSLFSYHYEARTILDQIEEIQQRLDALGPRVNVINTRTQDNIAAINELRVRAGLVPINVQ